MHLSIVFSTKSQPAAFVPVRVDADKMIQIAHCQSDENPRLCILPKVAGSVHCANKAIRRTVDVSLAQVIVDHLAKVHAELVGDGAGLFKGRHVVCHSALLREPSGEL